MTARYCPSVHVHTAPFTTGPQPPSRRVVTEREPMGRLSERREECIYKSAKRVVCEATE